ncbi:hypothetical protein HZH68_003833 [Vespula germanica]|uniref:Uncharacterized protein n=1 Tax=Vespula germanica TaxID=30212 RepID=A0A834KP19_VESGE|nr:hypothetical protein HZH68_003833 [Vespula germanica]
MKEIIEEGEEEEEEEEEEMEPEESTRTEHAVLISLGKLKNPILSYSIQRLREEERSLSKIALGSSYGFQTA